MPNSSVYQVYIRSLERHRREVFGEDTRVHNVNSTLERYPLSTAVRVGTCSGTLIWYRHVLTASHCVHTGTSLKSRKQIRVGLLRSNGTFRWLGVSKVFAPREWTRIKQNKKKIQYDYAVLELEQAHGRPWMRIGVS